MNEIILDLPFPVSMNSIWRSAGRHVYRHEKYQLWIKAATGAYYEQKKGMRITSIKGLYTLRCVFHEPDRRRRDLGNLEKTVSDFIEKAGIIQNDHYCREIILQYGSKEEAPLGARLFIRPVDKSTGSKNESTPTKDSVA